MGALGFDTLKENNPRFKNTGRTWFKKGLVPWNKGKKYTDEELVRVVAANRKIAEKREKKLNHPWYKKDWLVEQYVNQKKSFAEIGREFGVYPKNLNYWARKRGIPIRSTGESLLLDYETGRAIPRKRENHPGWKGGRGIAGKYVWVNTGCGETRLEHIVLAEKALGRRLRK